MTSGSAMRLKQTFGEKLFTLSEEGFIQKASVNPVLGFDMFQGIFNLTTEEMDNFEADDMWTFLEGVFTDFFLPHMRPSIQKMLAMMRNMDPEELEKKMALMNTQNAALNSATGSAV